MSEILPCPMCGGKASLSVDEKVDWGHSIDCSQCGLSTGGLASERMAVNHWNKRQPSDQWISVSERLPEDGDEVICCYVGVYGPRIVTFWRDAGLNPHFGGPRNQYRSQAATHWMPSPLPPPPTK